MLRAAAEAVGLDGEATMQRSQELRGAVQDRYEERAERWQIWQVEWMDYMEYMESKDGQDENFCFLNLYRITVNHGDIVHVLEDAFVPSLRCQEFSAMLGEVPHFLLREQAVDMTSAHGGHG